MSKTALVTGGARRIGAAICKTLHAAGYDIVIHYRSSAGEAEALRDSLNQLRPHSANLVAGDLLDSARLPDLIAQAISRFGRLDALINNASSFFPTPLGSIDDRSWDDLIGTNVKAPVFLAQAAADSLRVHAGCIVNIADIHAERPMRNHLVYNVGKAALVAATRSLARELGPEVRVNAVAPGANIWPEDESFIDEAARQRILDHSILKRGGMPEDIAGAVRYLVTEARYVTGHILAVDGGRSIVMAD